MDYKFVKVIPGCGTNGNLIEVQLHRPDKANALNERMIDELVYIGQELENLDQGVVVLTGAGEHFCSGMDTDILERFANGDSEIVDRLLSDYIGSVNRLQYIAQVWQRLRFPVIAVIHGSAFGAGLQIALGADFRFAGVDARLGLLESKRGLIPDMTGIARLRELLRPDDAKLLTMTGYTWSAQQAADMGLVTRVFENPDERAWELADTLAKRGPVVLRVLKEMLDPSVSSSESDILADEREEQRLLIKRARKRVTSGNEPLALEDVET